MQVDLTSKPLQMSPRKERVLECHTVIDLSMHRIGPRILAAQQGLENPEYIRGFGLGGNAQKLSNIASTLLAGVERQEK